MGNCFRYLISVLSIGLLTGCFEGEVFPDVPSITFKEIEFYDRLATDSLILAFYFEDGNADVGILDESDYLPPFHEYNVFLDSKDRVVTIDNLNEVDPPFYITPLVTKNITPITIFGQFISFRTSKNDYPVLAFIKQFFSEDVNDIPRECPGLVNQEGIFLRDITLTSYVNGQGSSLHPSGNPQKIIGALPVQRVETYYNLIIDFQKKVGDSYESMDFRKIFNVKACDFGIFSSRIPFFDEEGKSGTIRYIMQSTQFKGAFLDHTVRIKFHILDRAGNKSNEVFSQDFILADITQ